MRSTSHDGSSPGEAAVVGLVEAVSGVLLGAGDLAAVEGVPVVEL